MAYTVTKTDGSTLAIVSSNSVDTTTSSVALHGRGKLSWGNAANENFVHMLENFANSTAPTNPLQGQFWFDTSAQLVNVFAGSPISWQGLINDIQYNALLENFASATAPSSPVTGQHWYNPSLDELRYWDGSAWIEISTAGGSGALFVNVSGDTMTGNLVMDADINFSIPDLNATLGSPSSAITNGITWSGNTDQAKIYVQTLFPEISSLVLEISDNTGVVPTTGPDAIRLRHNSTTTGGSIREMVVASRERTSVFGSDQDVFRVSTNDSLYFGYIEYFTDKDTPLLPTARVGFMTTGDPAIGNELSTDFTIDNRSSVAGGTRAFDYKESNVLRLRYSGDGTSNIFAFVGPTNTGAAQALATDFSNAAFAIASNGFDLRLGQNDQINRGNTGLSRALVKWSGARLYINFGADFTGGTFIQSNTDIEGHLDMTGHNISMVGGAINMGGGDLNMVNGQIFNITAGSAADHGIRYSQIGSGSAVAKAWVSFENATAPGGFPAGRTIRRSYNVSSVSEVANQTFDINLSRTVNTWAAVFTQAACCSSGNPPSCNPSASASGGNDLSDSGGRMINTSTARMITQDNNFDNAIRCYYNYCVVYDSGA